MATYTSSQVMQTNSTTTMRAHVAFFEALMAAAGWVQTADTGQTAASAFPAATSTNTVAGYQVWRMADSLQGTYPVYVKFEFGSGAATNTLGLWFTIGTGSNGAGTITGILGSRFAVPQQTTSASSLPAYGSGGTARLCAIQGYQTATANCVVMWGIERSKDSAGADTGSGVIFSSQWGSALSNLAGWQYLPFSGTTRAAQVSCTIVANQSSTASMADGANVGLMPIYPMAQMGPMEQQLNYLLYYNTDIVVGNNISVTVKGSSHTYRTLGVPYNWSSATPLWGSSCFAIRYE